MPMEIQRTCHNEKEGRQQGCYQVNGEKLDVVMFMAAVMNVEPQREILLYHSFFSDICTPMSFHMRACRLHTYQSTACFQ
jgi:hypothetical protein